MEFSSSRLHHAMQLVYTNRNHFINGGNTRQHLYGSITRWFEDHLK